MKLQTFPLLAILSLALSFNGCAGVSGASALDWLTPDDRGGRVAATNLSYGTHHRQKLDVYVPNSPSAASETKPSPVMVFVYGGSWKKGSKEEYEFAGHAFAARGFVTVVIDYRIVPEVRYPAFVDDTAASIKWVVDHISDFGGDPERIFLSGHSAGAYNAVMVTLAPEFLAAHNLSPDILVGVIGISGPYSFLPLHPYLNPTFGHLEDLKPTQPVNRVTSHAPPILLLSGSDDETVPSKNVPALGDALRAAGDAVETKIYPGLDHAGAVMALSVLFRDKAPVLEDIIDFTKRVEKEKQNSQRLD